jgi:hypothetical protein
LLDSGWSILNEFGGLWHVRVNKWNTFSQIPRQRETKVKSFTSEHFRVSNLINHVTLRNMRQVQPVWMTKSYNFKRVAWEGNVLFFFKYFLKFFFNYLAGVISLWLMAVPFILPMPLFRRESCRKRFFNYNFISSLFRFCIE